MVPQVSRASGKQGSACSGLLLGGLPKHARRGLAEGPELSPSIICWGQRCPWSCGLWRGGQHLTLSQHPFCDPLPRQQEAPDLFQWLCSDSLKLCCPPGTFGPSCLREFSLGKELWPCLPLEQVEVPRQVERRLCPEALSRSLSLFWKSPAPTSCAWSDQTLSSKLRSPSQKGTGTVPKPLLSTPWRRASQKLRMELVTEILTSLWP